MQVLQFRVCFVTLLWEPDGKCRYKVTLLCVQTLNVFLSESSVMRDASLPQRLEAISIKYYYTVYRHLNHQACKSLHRVMFDYLWRVWLSHIYPNYFVNNATFGEKSVFGIKCTLFWFYFQLETFLHPGRIQRDVINVLISLCRVPDILTKLELFFVICYWKPPV